MNEIKFFKSVAVATAVVLLLTLSESIYFYNNPDKSISTSFYAAKLVLKIDSRSNIPSIILLSTANRMISNNEKLYPKIIPANYKYKIKLEKKENVEVVNNLLSQTHLETLNNKYKYNLARLFYDAAIANINNLSEKESFLNFIELSYFLDPTFGYWAVEYANYYNYIGDKNKALEILSTCQTVHAPTKQCSEFSTTLNRTEDKLPLGFLSDEIAKYFGGKSHTY